MVAAPLSYLVETKKETEACAATTVAARFQSPMPIIARDSGPDECLRLQDYEKTPKKNRISASLAKMRKTEVT